MTTPFFDICRRYAERCADDPEAALSEAQAAAAPLPASQRVAPPFWINRLVDGRLPVAALQLLDGLRLFELALDEQTGHPLPRAAQEARYGELIRWTQTIPSDGRHGVRRLDWSRLAWEKTVRSGRLRELDMWTLTPEVVTAVLHSPLCAELVSLNLSKGPWTAGYLGSHDDYLDAEAIAFGYLSQLRWSHLHGLPCAKTLERLYLSGTDLRTYGLEYDDDDENEIDFRYPPAEAPFPALRHLDLSRGVSKTHEDFLYDLLYRRAMPVLETLDLTDDFYPRVVAFQEEADEEDQIWLHHDYGAYLDLYTRYGLEVLEEDAPASLRAIAFGGSLGAVRQKIADKGLDVAISLVAELGEPDGVLPWGG